MSASLLAIAATTRQRLRTGGPPNDPEGPSGWTIVIWICGLAVMLAVLYVAFG